MIVESTEDLNVSLLKSAEEHLTKACDYLEYAEGNAQYDRSAVQKAIGDAKREIAETVKTLGLVKERLDS